MLKKPCEGCGKEMIVKTMRKQLCPECADKKRKAYMKAYNPRYNAAKHGGQPQMKSIDKISPLSRIAREAKEHGMDYGEYVARFNK